MALLTAVPKHLAHFAWDFGACLRNEAHKASPETYRLSRRAYIASHGLSRLACRRLYARLRPVASADSSIDMPLLATLRRDGLARVEHYLTTETTRALADYFRERPARPLRPNGADVAPVKLADATQTPRLTYDTRDVLAAPGVAELLADRSLQRLAAAYLRCQPIFTGIHAWWSLADAGADNDALSSAAQLFHFDYDWPAFVKFFFYLTDVGEQDGPFTYVLGTHEAKREWREGRVSDDYIQRSYGERVQRVTGHAGDMLIADTAGYHKGERVLAGPRLMLQMEFCVTRLGPGFQYERYPAAARPPSDYPHTFDVFCERP
jgi:hypothetical protein